MRVWGIWRPGKVIRVFLQASFLSNHSSINRPIMKKLVFLLPLWLSLYPIQAQDNGCVSGSCANGTGKYIYENGYIYEGNFKDGLRSGLGKLSAPNGDVYDGMWENDQFHGQGTYVWSDGSKYTGEWKNGVQDGYGIFFYPNGDKYNGYFQNNQFV